MSTVQLAIRNQRYAAALADLLERDGSPGVVLVETRSVTATGYCVDSPDARAATRIGPPPRTHQDRAGGGDS